MSTPAAVPTRAPPASGFDGLSLPLADHVTTDTVHPDDYRRIDAPEPTGTLPKAGDLVRFNRRGMRNGVAFISETTADSVDVEWLSGQRGTESLPVDEVCHELEYGAAEKLSSGLSRKQARYLLGCMTPIDGESDVSLSPSDLTLTREYSANVYDRFVNHPTVQHKLGANYCTERAVFGARLGGADGPIAALVVLAIPTARQLDQQATCELKRYAAHPRAPKNTASWLISRSLTWADLEGYARVLSYAGISNNEGAIYQALGFTSVEESDSATEGPQADLSAVNGGTQPALADGSGNVPDAEYSDTTGWAASREGRVEIDGYQKRDYEYRFTDSETTRSPSPEPITESTTEAATDLSAFGTGTSPDDGYSPESDLVSVGISALTQSDPDVIFGRWDTRPRAVEKALAEYGNETPASVDALELWEEIEKRGDRYASATFEGAFVASTPEGIAAVAVVDEPDDQARWEFDTLEITAYGACETGHPENMAATLLARIRDWAGLQGYSEVVGTADTDTTLEAAFRQAGYTVDGGENQSRARCEVCD